MTSTIQLQNPHQYPVDESSLKRAAQTVLDQTRNRRGACLSIVIADSATAREYNRQHRQIDAATDVLSFPALPLPEAIDAAADYLGDIIVAYDYLQTQCEARGCSLGDALCLLVIHGALHLLGHDHDSAASRERMWNLQETALRSLGISPALLHDYAAVTDG